MVPNANEKKDNNSDELKDLIENTLHPKSERIRPLRRKQRKQKKPKPPKEEATLLVFDELREALSVTRDFAVKGYFSAEGSHKTFPEEYRNLANSHRDAIVKILACTRHDIHCTIKYCASGKRSSKKNTKIWTFARSYEHGGRGMKIGPGTKIPVYKNSSFSSILGCKDSNKNNWECRRNQCFSCNDLIRVPQYADSKKDWSSFYISGVVFPIRYEAEKDGVLTDFIMGFLTFDSPIENVFEGIPSKFEYIGEPERYITELRKTDVYHVGHALADAIATATILAGTLNESDAVYIQGDD